MSWYLSHSRIYSSRILSSCIIVPAFKVADTYQLTLRSFDSIRDFLTDRSNPVISLLTHFLRSLLVIFLPFIQIHKVFYFIQIHITLHLSTSWLLTYLIPIEACKKVPILEEEEKKKCQLQISTRTIW